MKDEYIVRINYFPHSENKELLSPKLDSKHNAIKWCETQPKKINGRKPGDRKAIAHATIFKNGKLEQIVS